MLSFREIDIGLRGLNINPNSPVIIHASMSAFGEVQGGAETFLGAITNCFHAVMAPTFTSKTAIIPHDGPANNAIKYGSGEKSNALAEFYNKDTTPADKLMGVTAEKIRTHPNAQRSNHPLLSFAGINVENALQKQTLQQPLAPIFEIAQHQGWVLLFGVDHTVNTSLHLAERLSGRKQFVRWALASGGILECPNIPGCSDGFGAIQPYLSSITRQVVIGSAAVNAIPIQPMLDITLELLRTKPHALLCNGARCERCNAVRQSLVRVKPTPSVTHSKG